MNKYECFEDFVNAFLKSDDIRQPKVIEIAGSVYSFSINEHYTIDKALNACPLVGLYVPKAGPSVGLSWRLRGQQFVPEHVEFVPFVETLNEEQMVIGDSVELSFPLFPSAKHVRGKVDTGADISSLHVTQWKITGEKITFVSPLLSNNNITMLLKDKQAVKSADGGIEYRPVIELDVVVNGKHISKAVFNLNDRSHMEFPILVGQNILEKGKFLVNPSINEQYDNIDWLSVENYFRSK